MATSIQERKQGPKQKLRTLFNSWKYDKYFDSGYTYRQYLLDDQIDVNDRLSVLFCYDSNNWDAVEQFLRLGANPYHVPTRKKSVYTGGTATSSDTFLDMLYAWGVGRHIESQSAVLVASKTIYLIDFLPRVAAAAAENPEILCYPAPPSKYSLLHYAALVGEDSLINAIIEANPETTSAEKDDALYVAAVRDHWPAVQVLIAKGANPNTINLGREENVFTVLAKDEDSLYRFYDCLPDEYGPAWPTHNSWRASLTPRAILDYAASRGRVKLIGSILAANILQASQLPDASEALQTALSKRQVSAVACLLEAKANPFATSYGKSLFERAKLWDDRVGDHRYLTILFSKTHTISNIRKRILRDGSKKLYTCLLKAAEAYQTYNQKNTWSWYNNAGQKKVERFLQALPKENLLTLLQDPSFFGNTGNEGAHSFQTYIAQALLSEYSDLEESERNCLARIPKAVMHHLRKDLSAVTTEPRDWLVNVSVLVPEHKSDAVKPEKRVETGFFETDFSPAHSTPKPPSPTHKTAIHAETKKERKKSSQEICAQVYEYFEQTCRPGNPDFESRLADLVKILGAARNSGKYVGTFSASGFWASRYATLRKDLLTIPENERYKFFELAVQTHLAKHTSKFYPHLNDKLSKVTLTVSDGGGNHRIFEAAALHG